MDQPPIDGLHDRFALLNSAVVSGGRQAFNATVCSLLKGGFLLICKWLCALVFREQAQLFSAFAKQFDEPLLKVGAGKRDALFPSTDRLRFAADLTGDIRLGPAASLTFILQAVRCEQMLVHIDLSFSLCRT